MKKILLTTALVLSATIANEAQSAGLYLGAGYGRIDPKLSFSTLSAASGDYGLQDSVAGWPSRNDDSPDMGNALGYQAADWEAGHPETDTYHTKKGNEYSLAIGWKIPRNPFSFELEYKMMDFDSSGYTLQVNDPLGSLYGIVETDCADGTVTDGCVTDGKTHYIIDTDGTLGAPPIDVSSYTFDINYTRPMETKINALMLNVYVEIPGLGPIDPYIGYGYGRAKSEFTFYDEAGTEFTGGSDGFVKASQYMLGVDYRITGTPWIIGAEYRKFKSDFDEKDDKIPYKSENKSIMLKVKYDFVSDKY